MRNAEDLVARWPLRAQPDLGGRLVERYAEPHRSYHDARHLAEVLDRLDLLLPEVAGSVDREAVVLAAWFHDAVYDTGPDRAAHNEERSAVLAESELRRAGVPPDRVAEVARLVRLTAEHDAAADDPAGAVLCDADLGVLAAEPDRYDEYATAVREEYAHVPDDAFRHGRAGVLRRLLALDPIFRTAPAAWERAARANVMRELAALEG